MQNISVRGSRFGFSCLNGANWLSEVYEIFQFVLAIFLGIIRHTMLPFILGYIEEILVEFEEGGDYIGYFF